MLSYPNFPVSSFTIVDVEMTSAILKKILFYICYHCFAAFLCSICTDNLNYSPTTNVYGEKEEL